MLLGTAFIGLLILSGVPILWMAAGDHWAILGILAFVGWCWWARGAVRAERAIEVPDKGKVGVESGEIADK